MMQTTSTGQGKEHKHIVARGLSRTAAIVQVSTKPFSHARTSSEILNHVATLPVRQGDQSGIRVLGPLKAAPAGGFAEQPLISARSGYCLARSHVLNESPGTTSSYGQATEAAVDMNPRQRLLTPSKGLDS